MQVGPGGTRPDPTLNSAGAEAERSDDQRGANKKDVAVQVRPADLGAPAAEPAVVVGLYGVWLSGPAHGGLAETSTAGVRICLNGEYKVWLELNKCNYCNGECTLRVA